MKSINFEQRVQKKEKVRKKLERHLFEITHRHRQNPNVKAF